MANVSDMYMRPPFNGLSGPVATHRVKWSDGASRTLCGRVVGKHWKYERPEDFERYGCKSCKRARA